MSIRQDLVVLNFLRMTCYKRAYFSSFPSPEPRCPLGGKKKQVFDWYSDQAVDHSARCKWRTQSFILRCWSSCEKRSKLWRRCGKIGLAHILQRDFPDVGIWALSLWSNIRLSWEKFQVRWPLITIGQRNRPRSFVRLIFLPKLQCMHTYFLSPLKGTSWSLATSQIGSLWIPRCDEHFIRRNIFSLSWRSSGYTCVRVRLYIHIYIFGWRVCKLLGEIWNKITGNSKRLWSRWPHRIDCCARRCKRPSCLHSI